MIPSAAIKYLKNCFLLTIPILAWNFLLASRLPRNFQPDTFWQNIPSVIAIGENTFRTIIFLLSFVMPLSINSERQRMGLGLYIAGLGAYFASWVALIYFPESCWSLSLSGFLAPAYTPIIWLVGIALIGQEFYFNLRYRLWLFMVPSIAFLVFHNAHTIIVYSRMHY